MLCVDEWFYCFLLMLCFVWGFFSCSFMGRSVIDLPPKTINDAIYINENTLHWDKYAVVGTVSLSQ